MDELLASLEPFSGSDLVQGTEFFTKYHPVTAESVKVFSWHADGGGYLEEWTRCDSLTTATSFFLFDVQEWDGKIQLSNEQNGTLFVDYTAVPSVEYVPLGADESQTLLQVDEHDLRRVTMDDDAFFMSIGSSRQVSYLKVEPVLTDLSDSYWGTAFYGGQSVPIVITVYDSEDSPISGAPVNVSFEGIDPSFISGYGTEMYSDPRGRVIFDYVTPPLDETIGTKVSGTEASSTYIKVDSSFVIPDPTKVSMSDYYVYQIRKDDPLIGKGGADTSIGEILWDPTRLNGRKVVLYQWDTDAIHPILETVGAFVPVHPAQYSTESTQFQFTSTLTAPDTSTATSTMIGGYWVVGPTQLTVQASVSDMAYGSATSCAKIITGLSTNAVGNHIFQGSDYPYGWRLPSSGVDVASALDGALYLTVNPVSGDYDILFEEDTIGIALSPANAVGIEFYVS